MKLRLARPQTSHACQRNCLGFPSSQQGADAMIALGPLGDRAFLARFATEDEAARWVAAVRARRWPGVEDVVMAYQTAAVYADPDRVDLDELEAKLRDVPVGDGGARAGPADPLAGPV